MRKLSGAILLMAAGAALPAVAYVVAPPSIVRQFAVAQASDHATPGPLMGRAGLAGASEEVPAKLEVTKGSCRSEVETPAGKAVASWTNGQSASEGAALPSLAAWAALACPLITLHDVPPDEAEKAVQTFARAIGVDYSVSSLSMVDGRVGLIVGAHPRQYQRPQIWFDKMTNRPMRIIASHAGQVWDIRIADAASVATNRLAPRRSSVWKGSEKQMELHWMAVTPVPPGDSAPILEEEGED